MSVSARKSLSRLSLGASMLAAALSAGCAPYDGVPIVAIEGIENGLLYDNKSPLSVTFSEPIDPTSLKAKVAIYETDIEGNLFDEDDDEETELQVLVAFDGSAKDPAERVQGGTASVAKDGQRLFMLPELSFPIGKKLVLIIEPGLMDTEGDTFKVREKILFSYTVKLNCAPSADFVSGAYFFLGEVTKPIGTQVQLHAYIEVNPATGEFVGTFVNADRDRDPARCKAFGLSCTDKEACRTLPTPACVPPSEKAGGVDEYPDYVVNYDPPSGYAFEATGCVDGQSGPDTIFVNVPVDVTVSQPAVSLRATTMTASFAKDDKGVLRGTGGIVAENVLLGKIDSGQAEGSIAARLIPPEEEPKGLKRPPAAP